MNIINLYEKYFDTQTKKIFEKLSESEYKIYLIGGLVRDMLLGMPSQDIDITVEGNAVEFAQSLECNILSTHEDFGTVKIELDGIYIDLASTRTETYPRQGHLPVIETIGCPLKSDILRRDFTINSLAMSLNKQTFGEVIDFTNGLADLEAKKLNVLHPQSFIDDPSRILRGLKYAQRLGFSLGKDTLKLQNEYLSNINYDMSYKRIHQEFFKTKWDVSVFNEFITQGIYKLINAEAPTKFDFTEKATDPLVYFTILLPDCRFELEKKERNIIEAVRELVSFSSQSDFEIYKTFASKDVEIAQALAILNNSCAKRYLNNLKDVKILTSGKDLIELGLKPSKEFGNIFDKLVEKKLQNPTLTKEQELSFVKSLF